MHRLDRAGIRAALASVFPGRYSAKTISCGAVTACAVELMPVGITPGGEKNVMHFYRCIPCALPVCGKGSLPRQPLWTTLYRIGEINDCSGIRQIGSPCARIATTGKQGAGCDLDKWNLCSLLSNKQTYINIIDYMSDDRIPYCSALLQKPAAHHAPNRSGQALNQPG